MESGSEDTDHNLTLDSDGCAEDFGMIVIARNSMREESTSKNVRIRKMTFSSRLRRSNDGGRRFKFFGVVCFPVDFGLACAKDEAIGMNLDFADTIFRDGEGARELLFPIAALTESSSSPPESEESDSADDVESVLSLPPL
jgi:hypothetical protein